MILFPCEYDQLLVHANRVDRCTESQNLLRSEDEDVSRYLLDVEPQDVSSQLDVLPQDLAYVLQLLLVLPKLHILLCICMKDKKWFDESCCQGVCV